MKILVFCPTRQYGGLDVLWAVLDNQVGLEDHQVGLLAGDELQDMRHELWEEVWPSAQSFRVPLEDGNMRNLCASYNVALATARKNGVELLVSAQDYFWWPKDTLARTAYMAEQSPNAIYTGAASLYTTPGVERVANHEGLWSIFDRPFDYTADEPQETFWYDCRADMFSDMSRYHLVSPVEWETNYAAIGPGPLADNDIWFDEEFDKAIAYENQDFAALCRSKGYGIIYDPGIHVKGLPHKRYRPDIEEREAPHTDTNRQLVYDKWGF